jgi:hypothetical protein
VDRNQWPGIYDRDLDVIRRRPSDPTEPIDRYRRFVANPLLAVSSIILSLLTLKASLVSKFPGPGLFLIAVVWLGYSIRFTQFHCLDCGETDWVRNARRHACTPLVARWRAGRMGLWRIPALGTQLALWFYVLASMTALLLILFVFSR